MQISSLKMVNLLRGLELGINTSGRKFAVTTGVVLRREKRKKVVTTFTGWSCVTDLSALP
jgi:hypothetical protein